MKPTGGDTTERSRNEQFLHFIRLFQGVESHKKLFPKECRVCGKKFASYPEYVRDTLPKGHMLEDCREVMKRAFTMMYRHCVCGNTLILAFTDEIVPWLDAFWSMLRREADRSGQPIRQVVKEFGRQCDRYIISRLDSSARSAEEDLPSEIA